VLLAVLAMLACQVHATEEDGDRGLSLVESFVSGIDSFSGRFRQSLVDADGVVIDETAGTVEILRPGRFRWDNTEPYEQWLVADGLNIWNYDVDLEQVTVKPQATALANTPALILSGASDAFEQFEYIESYQEADYYWVRLDPREADAGFDRMELGFLDDVLYRMVFFDNLGQTTLVQLEDVEVNPELDPVRFEFEIPEFADLIGTPASADDE
jgi:outer membrane lipoprotein carrier protein